MPMRFIWLGFVYFWTRANGEPHSYIGAPCDLSPEPMFFIGRCFFKCVTSKYVDEYPVCSDGQAVQLCDERRKCTVGKCQKVPCTCMDNGCSFQCYRSITICFASNKKPEFTTQNTSSLIPTTTTDFERGTLYERAWPTVLPIFLMIFFSVVMIHSCHWCCKKTRRVPQAAPVPSAPIAPTSPLMSPPLVVTFASIHSNPFEQHLTPHATSLLMQSVIREADPRARPPIGHFLQLRREHNPQPSAPSADLVITPLAPRPRNILEPDLPPPYHLALQLEEPPPPYSESNARIYH